MFDSAHAPVGIESACRPPIRRIQGRNQGTEPALDPCPPPPPTEPQKKGATERRCPQLSTPHSSTRSGVGKASCDRPLRGDLVADSPFVEAHRIAPSTPLPDVLGPVIAAATGFHGAYRPLFHSQHRRLHPPRRRSFPHFLIPASPHRHPPFSHSPARSSQSRPCGLLNKAADGPRD